MKIFGLEFNKKPIQTQTQDFKIGDIDMTAVMAFSIPDMPRVIINQRQEWINFGEDNLYPQGLTTLINSSSIHNAILESKAKMITGRGIEIENISNPNDPRTLALINKFIKDPNNTEQGIDDETIEDIIYKIAFDYETFGALALEVTWSVDFTRIASIKHVDVSRVRIGKTDCEKIEDYYYSENWSNIKKHAAVCIKAFNPKDKENYNQLIYVRNVRPGIDYYGAPSYMPAVRWINIDSQMSQFHSSNLENGFNPSLSVKFYKKPQSLEERDTIVREFNKQFRGTKNTGKAMMFFSDGKDFAPDVDVIPVTGLDKQLLILADQVVQQIISAHRVTSPMLLGIALPGKLGYANELASAYAIFDSTVITPTQLIIERTLTNVLEYWGVKGEVDIIKLDASALGVFKSIPSEVMAHLTPNELRALAGYEPLEDQTENKII